MPFEKVTIAPLVLLSVVDHYRRVSAPRVVGVLLGNTGSTVVNITNSFAVPFEETEENFFFDTSYLHNMFELFYKVNCAEKIVGWYHTGPRMYKSDLDISRSFSRYCTDPVLAIVDVEMKASDIPVEIFQLLREKALVNLDVQVGADETEEVGVEHLLRDIKEGTGCSLRDRFNEIRDSLKMYRDSLDDIIEYIGQMQKSGNADFEILELIQEILNEIPVMSSNADMTDIYSLELTNAFIMMNDLKRNRLENGL